MKIPPLKKLLAMPIAERNAILRQYHKEKNDERLAAMDAPPLPSTEHKKNWPRRPEDELSASEFTETLKSGLYY